jgi:N-acetylneuraminic acid mutarotase
MYIINMLTLIALQIFQLTWTSKSPLPRALAGSGCVVMNDTVYVVGGRDTGSARYPTLYTYDPVNDQWDSLAPMSISRGHVVAAVLNGKIYVCGGWIGSTATNAVEEYDRVTNTWTNKSPMPTARYCSGIAVVNDLIYVIGGMDMSGSVFATVEAYNPVMDTWETKTPMPLARFGPGCAVINDTIYAFGGSTAIGGGSTNVNQCYDPVTDSWISKGSMNEDRYCLGGFEYGGKAYSVGGYDYHVYHTTVEAYEPVSNSWSYDTPMIYGRQSVAVGVLGEYVYVIGGWNNGSVAYNEEGFLGTNINEQISQFISNVSVHPNPFFSTVMIQLQMSARETSHLRIKNQVSIYDICGHMIKKLSLTPTVGSQFAVSWDGTDEHGTPLSSGTYFIVVEVNNKRHTEKVILVR